MCEYEGIPEVATIAESTESGSALFSDDSLLVRYMGDWRSILPGISAGILQMAHPAVSAALVQHSRFLESRSERDSRIVRSIPQIWGTVLGKPDELGRRGSDIRDAHLDINGTDHHGASYRALDPETFWWGHATFTWEVFRSVELFHREQLTETERDALYAETLTWYRLYGVTSRPAPKTYDAFIREFERVSADVLELTPAAKVVRVGPNYHKRRASYSRRPRKLMRQLLDDHRGMIGAGCLAEETRELLQIPWTADDEKRFRIYRSAVASGFVAIPPAVNRATLSYKLRRDGVRTADQRIRAVGS